MTHLEALSTAIRIAFNRFSLRNPVLKSDTTRSYYLADKCTDMSFRWLGLADFLCVVVHRLRPVCNYLLR